MSWSVNVKGKVSEVYGQIEDQAVQAIHKLQDSSVAEKYVARKACDLVLYALGHMPGVQEVTVSINGHGSTFSVDVR